MCVLMVRIFMLPEAEIPYFFSRNGLPPLTHSIFSFFFTLWKKKCKFFFLRKSLQAIHSPEERTPTKKAQNHLFFAIFSHFGSFIPQSFVFFFQENLTTHSLTQFQGAGKKNSGVKKKHTQFALTQSIFAQNLQK